MRLPHGGRSRVVVVFQHRRRGERAASRDGSRSVSKFGTKVCRGSGRKAQTRFGSPVGAGQVPCRNYPPTALRLDRGGFSLGLPDCGRRAKFSRCSSRIAGDSQSFPATLPGTREVHRVFPLRLPERGRCIKFSRHCSRFAGGASFSPGASACQWVGWLGHGPEWNGRLKPRPTAARARRRPS